VARAAGTREREGLRQSVRGTIVVGPLEPVRHRLARPVPSAATTCSYRRRAGALASSPNLAAARNSGRDRAAAFALKIHCRHSHLSTWQISG
jgi:hypothetical protein